MKKQTRIGSGSQAEVYTCSIKELADLKCVTKTKTVVNNNEIAQTVLREMLGEFLLASSLSHPNIVNYKYFCCKYDH